jgi:hypothetical protein
VLVVVILLVVGFLAGWWCGVRWAEYWRARHDMRRAWEGRKNWREHG